MRVLALTAGAGGMICGSCLRDNALAAELARRGWDVRLVPLYTPTRTDEPNVSEGRVLFSGVSLYAQHAVPFFRRHALLDPFFDAGFTLRAASALSSSTNPGSLGPLTVTTLLGEAGPARREIGKLCRTLAADAGRFDLVVLPNSLLIGLAAPLARALDAPVVVTFSGEDLFLDHLPGPYRERAQDLMRDQTAHAAGFVATSVSHADGMAERLRLPRERVAVVRLGVDPTGYPETPKEPPAFPSEGGPGTRPVTIGHLSRIAPEKGFDRLVEAVIRLRREPDCPPLRLAAAGWLGARHRRYFQAAKDRLAAEAPDIPFEFQQEPDRARKIAFLRAADVIALPSAYPEAKGMPAIEAMMAGTPVVVPREGAWPDLLDHAEGGVLAKSSGPDDFAAALSQLVMHEERRFSVGARGFERIRETHPLARMADDAMAAYSEAVEAARRPAA